MPAPWRPASPGPDEHSSGRHLRWLAAAQLEARPSASRPATPAILCASITPPIGWTDSGDEYNAFRLTLPQPARSAQGTYSDFGEAFGLPGIAASSLLPAAGLDLWVASIVVAGLFSLFAEETAGGAAFARGFCTSH